MATFKVLTEPTIKTENTSTVKNGDSIRKFIYYVIEFDEADEKGKKIHYRKERGLKNYDISLVRGDANEQRKNEQLLLRAVKNDLANGVDPQRKFEHTVAKAKAKIAEVQKIEDAKVSLDDAIKLLKDAKGYSGNKIAEGKEVTAAGYLSLFKNDFRRFVTLIGKQDDIRAVTKEDIKDYIELHFNPSDKYLYTVGKNKGKRIFENWSSKSCTTQKNTISSLFSVLVDKNLISTNPCFGVKIKKDSEKIDIKPATKDIFELWTQEEMNIFFNDTDDPETLFYSTVGKCIHYSCIRKAELFRIRVGMVNFVNERFSIPARLTKAARKYKNPNEMVHIDIPDNLLDSLKKWINYKYPNGWNEESYLFPHRTKITQKHDYPTFNSEWNAFRKKLRLKYEGMFMKNIYALKHNGLAAYFHALLKRQDLTPAEVILKVQNLARHSSFAETENYLRNHNLMFPGKREKVNF